MQKGMKQGMPPYTDVPGVYFGGGRICLYISPTLYLPLFTFYLSLSFSCLMVPYLLSLPFPNPYASNFLSIFISLYTDNPSLDLSLFLFLHLSFF